MFSYHNSLPKDHTADAHFEVLLENFAAFSKCRYLVFLIVYLLLVGHVGYSKSFSATDNRQCRRHGTLAKSRIKWFVAGALQIEGKKLLICDEGDANADESR